MNLDIGKILRILPHRPPFVLIDRVLELEPRRSAVAIKCVTYNEPFFPGHFPGTPIFPAVLILEAMSQLMCVLACASNALDTQQQIFYFLGIEKAKFRHPVTPGDQMTLEVKVLRRRSNIWTCAGTATVGDVLCAEATLVAAMTDRDDATQA